MIGDNVKTSSYGTWSSPITAGLIASGTVKFGQMAISKGEIYWTESRSNEGGRMTLLKQNATGEVTEITPAPLSVRTKVHEYGGGAFCVGDGCVYFSNFSDQRLYVIDDGEGKTARPLTEMGKLRYSDGVVDSFFVIAVREDHSHGGSEPKNEIVAIDRRTGATKVLVSGADFYAFPRISPDGNQLAWICWNHPNMPWDSSELWLAEYDGNGSIRQPVKIAGKPGESVTEPNWSSENRLYYVSDVTGWWNLYQVDGTHGKAICPQSVEFSGPLWNLGLSTYGFIGPQTLLCAVRDKGISSLVKINAVTGNLEKISLPYTEFTQVKCEGQKGYFFAASPSAPWRISSLDPISDKCKVERIAYSVEIDPKYLSEPKAIEFSTAQKKSAHAFFYAPRNPDFAAPAGELPPLMVISHGGPTGACATSLSLEIQYWTSRGFGVVDVNYGGSTGYGTEYRRRLNGNWGIVDVEDCINAAAYLTEKKLVDGNRLVIRGASAGGFTTLAALTFHNVFKAGASYFGISDIELCAKETHKFESRYEASLVGPYPERRDLFIERSPLYSVDRISCPLLLLQGLDDKVVPHNQAELMYKAVKAKGIPVAYIAYEGEDHGFRKKENIQNSLESEQYFYSRVFGYSPADVLKPFFIDNLIEP